MAFFFLILYLVLILIRPQDWYAPLAGFRLVDPVAIITILATFLSKRPSEPMMKVLSRDKYVRFMWGFLAAMVLSDLYRLRIRWAWEAIGDFGKVAMLFFLMLVILDDTKRLKRMMWVFVWCATALSIHGIMQWRTGSGFGGITPIAYSGEAVRLQYVGIFGDPNDLASLFIMSTPLVLGLWQMGGSFFSKGLLMAVLPASVIVLYHTHSRGGLVGFCAMLLAYLWLAGKSSMLRLMVAAVMLAGVVAFAPGRATGSYLEGSAGGRIVLWGIGNQLLKQYPLLGVGYQNFTYFSTQVAHNSFVTCYSELGVIGYVFWFGLSWVVMKSLLRLARMKEYFGLPIAKMAAALFAALVGYHASGFFLTRTYNHVLYILLGMGIGLIRYVRRLPEVPAGFLDISTREFRQTLVYSALSIPVIWILIRMYWSRAGGG